MSYLRYLCLIAYSGVQHIVLYFCFVFLRLVYTVLPGFSGLSIFIAHLVFSNVYLIITVFVLYWSVFDYEYKPLIRNFHDHKALTSQ